LREESGGGVYIDGRTSKRGLLKKTGGIIFGSDADVASDKNIANNQGGGNAVYDKGDTWDYTLDKEDWPLK